MSDIITGLSVFGSILNNNNKIKKSSSSNKILNNFNNIYNNDMFYDNINTVKQKAKLRTMASKNPKKTGVIPPFYNSNRFDPFDNNNNSNNRDNSDNSDDDCSDNILNRPNLNNPACFLNKEDEFKSSITNKSQFLNQFDDLAFDNPSNPTPSNLTNDFINDNNGNKKLFMKTNLNLIEGYSNFESKDDMTYGIVNKKNFVHNNMMPFFKSKEGGYNFNSEYKKAENNQRKLELFSGSVNNLDYRPKTERKKLFDPVTGLTNLYGTPVLTDVLSSRYIPSNERRNEKPFQEQRVTPGLNLGYNEVGISGYHDPFRVLPKNVDQLRTANNTKTTYSTVIIPGMKGQRGKVASKMYKRRPLTFYESKPEDNIRGQSYIKAQTIHANVNSNNLATINRGTDSNKHGSLGGAAYYTNLHKTENLIEKTRESIKENFQNDNGRNLQILEAKDARGNELSYNAKINLRNLHEKQDRAGNVGNSEYSKNYVFDGVNWIPDNTMRDIHDTKDRAGNVGNSEYSKNYVFDGINWIPETTMRDIHDTKDRVGLVGNSEHSKNYVYDGVNWIPENTMRDIHDKKDRVGLMGTSEINKNYVYDGVNWIPENTMRDIHDKKDRVGLVGNAENSKNYVYDGVNWIPNNTMRDIHDKTERAGNLGKGEYNKNYVYDGVNWIPNNTMRDIHDKTERAGNLGKGEYNKNYVYDGVNWIPNNTMRDIHDKTERAGNLGKGEYNKNYVYDGVNWIPENTMRDIHNKTERAGNSNEDVSIKKDRSRGDVNNMRLNTEKEVIALGRTPTITKDSRGPIIDYTMINLKNEINNNRELYPDIKQNNISQFEMINTKSKQLIPQQSFRFYSFVDENLNNNKYVNNIVHQNNN